METYIMYKFICNDENIITSYVGHTKSFTKRKSTHKNSCNNENNKSYNFKLYVEMRANGGWDNWIMCPIEEYKCDNKIQARIREQYWTDLQAEKLNMRNAYIESKQLYDQKYNLEHKDEIKLQRQQFYLEHKEDLKLYQQQYRLKHKNK